MNKSELGRLLADNLKHLNAKERDHLMRFAYLGETGPYTSSETFLSDSFLGSLKAALKIPEEKATRCLFAGMDYHIDWLFAAMFMTAKELNISDGERNKHERDLPPKDSDLDLRPILGNQEDVDLLALLETNNTLHLVFIEAKGVKGFDRKQLGRKIIRVHESIINSRPTKHEADWPDFLKFTYLLASGHNDNPINGTLYEYVKRSKSESEPMKSIKKRIACIKDGHAESATLHTPNKRLEIENYPAELWQVQRCNEKKDTKLSDGNYTHWELAPRPARRPAPSKT